MILDTSRKKNSVQAETGIRGIFGSACGCEVAAPPPINYHGVSVELEEAYSVRPADA